jgi:tRNA modification GTPase
MLVLDGECELDAAELKAVERSATEPERERTVIVVNKCDLPGAAERKVPHVVPLRVSALTGEGTGALRIELRRRLVGTGQLEAPIITDARHARALEQTLAALGRAAEAGESGLTEELVLEDLRDAMRCLGTITGEFTTDDLYDRIFSTFCIGK